MESERDRYRDAHAKGAVTERYGRFREVIKKDFSKISGHILRTNPQEFLNILDIGGGDGRSLIQIVKPLIEDGRDISIDYLDVSVDQAKAFLENISQEGLARKIDRLNLTSWEDFEIDPNNRYNVVLALHSWYGIGYKTKEGEHPLEKIDSALCPLPCEGSAAYIVVSRKGNLLDAIGKKMLVSRITGEDISKELKRLGRDHEVQDIYDNQFQLERLLLKNPKKLTDFLTYAGEDIFAYITRKSYSNLRGGEKIRLKMVFDEQKENPEYAVNDLIIIPEKGLASE